LAFGSIYVLPQIWASQGLQRRASDGALTGLPQLLLIPLVPMLMKRFDIASSPSSASPCSCFVLMNTTCR
jgi:hypothetical protein